MATCWVEDCARRLYAKGLCNLHYQRVRDTGEPGPAASTRQPRTGTCAVDACENAVQCRGWCRLHYDRWRLSGDVKADMPLQKKRPKAKCDVSDCGRPHAGRGLCDAHLRRWRTTGSVGERPIGSRGRKSRLNRSGYRLVWRPEHPNAGGDGYVLEHRLVMSEIVGRPLLPGETVHHINGDRADNRPANLELWSKAHVPGQRVSDRVEWATELLRRYAPERLAQ